MDVETAAVELLEALDATYDEVSGVSIVDTLPGTVQDAVSDLRDALKPPRVDQTALAKLIANAEWKPRPDYGDNVSIAYHDVGGPVADALDWECTSCRPDVGWADWTSMERDANGTITLHVECGHCGTDYHYDAVGEPID